MSSDVFNEAYASLRHNRRRTTLTMMGCPSLGLLPGFIRSNPALGLTVDLANFPTQEEVCR